MFSRRQNIIISQICKYDEWFETLVKFKSYQVVEKMNHLWQNIDLQLLSEKRFTMLIDQIDQFYKEKMDPNSFWESITDFNYQILIKWNESQEQYETNIIEKYPYDEDSDDDSENNSDDHNENNSDDDSENNSDTYDIKNYRDDIINIHENINSIDKFEDKELNYDNSDIKNSELNDKIDNVKNPREYKETIPISLNEAKQDYECKTKGDKDMFEKEIRDKGEDEDLQILVSPTSGDDVKFENSTCKKLEGENDINMVDENCNSKKIIHVKFDNTNFENNICDKTLACNDNQLKTHNIITESFHLDDYAKTNNDNAPKDRIIQTDHYDQRITEIDDKNLNKSEGTVQYLDQEYYITNQSRHNVDGLSQIQIKDPNNIISCDVCGLEFLNNEELENHIQDINFDYTSIIHVDTNITDECSYDEFYDEVIEPQIQELLARHGLFSDTSQSNPIFEQIEYDDVLLNNINNSADYFLISEEISPSIKEELENVGLKIDDKLNNPMPTLDVQINLKINDQGKTANFEHAEILVRNEITDKKNAQYMVSTCEKCSRKLSHTSELNEHMRHIHNCLYSCDICDNVFPKLSKLKLHIKSTHRFIYNNNGRILQLYKLRKKITQEIFARFNKRQRKLKKIKTEWKKRRKKQISQWGEYVILVYI